MARCVILPSRGCDQPPPLPPAPLARRPISWPSPVSAAAAAVRSWYGPPPPLPSPPPAEWVTAAAALLRVMTPPADERLWQASSDVIGRHLASPSVTWRNQTPCGETACQRVVLGSGRFGEIGWRGPFNLRGVEHISGMFMPSDSARGGGGVENYL